MQITGTDTNGSAELSMLRCLIQDCESGEGGGALMAYRAKVWLSRCVVKNNKAQVGGGGVKLWGCPSATLEHCMFLNNAGALAHVRRATEGGGGILVEYSRDVMLKSCELRGNRAGTPVNAVLSMHAFVHHALCIMNVSMM